MDNSERERSLVRSALARTAACPEIEALATAGTDAGVRRHVDSCQRCRTELALLERFDKGTPAADEAGSLRWIVNELAERQARIPHAAQQPVRPIPGLARRFGAWRVLGWAASMAIVIAVFVYERPVEDRPVPGGGQPVWRSTQIAAISPAGDLAAAPALLKWEAVPDAAAYRVRVMEIDGTVLWSETVSSTSAELPAKVIAAMVPGRTFQWEVSAWNQSIQKLGSTELQTFHILPTVR